MTMHRSMVPDALHPYMIVHNEGGSGEFVTLNLVRLAERIEASGDAEAARRDAARDLDMAQGCLNMIHETLVAYLGEDGMKGCPPMFYNDAIRKIWQNGARQVLVVVESIPAAYQVRVCEGAGPEDVYASLAVSVTKLVAALPGAAGAR